MEQLTFGDETVNILRLRWATVRGMHKTSLRVHGRTTGSVRAYATSVGEFAKGVLMNSEFGSEPARWAAKTIEWMELNGYPVDLSDEPES